MDLLRSYFFKNESLISCPFLSSKLDSPVIKTLERHSLYVKKCENIVRSSAWSFVHSDPDPRSVTSLIDYKTGKFRS